MSTLSELIQQQSQYVYQSEKWLNDVLGFHCIDWQSEACKDYDKFGHCAWSTGTGVGKTALLARLALHFLATRTFPVVPVIAPTQRQLHNALWAEIVRAIRSSPMLLAMFEWTQERVFLKNHREDWFAVAITARPPKQADVNTVESIQGIHAENVLVMVDECSGVPDQVMGAVDGLISTPTARSILASNPTRNTGYFYKVTHSPELEKLWSVKFVDSESINANFIDRAYIERLKVIYGEDSDYFRMRVRGLPPRTEFNALVSPEQVYAAHQRKLEGTGHKFLSTDVARYGNDDTVYFLRDGNTILERIDVHGMDTVKVAKIGIEFFDRHDIEEWRIDVIGIGAGVVDYAKSELGAKKNRVIGVHVGSDATNKEEFYNLRAEIAWAVRSSIDSISIPIDTPLLDEELVDIKYTWDNKDKKIKVESKDSIKARLGRSPNDFDSFALSIANLKSPNAIMPLEYFKISGVDTHYDPIPATKNSGLRNNAALKMLADRYNNVGINRYSIFKEDFTDFRSLLR